MVLLAALECVRCWPEPLASLLSATVAGMIIG